MAVENEFNLEKERFDFLTSYTSGLRGAIFIWYGNFIGLNTAKVVKEFGSIYNNLLLKKNDFISFLFSSLSFFFNNNFSLPADEKKTMHHYHQTT